MLATLRVYLTGRISIEHGSKLLDERQLAGRQGRLAFAFLAKERHCPVSREQLTSIVWSDTPPREADAALNAILSKLRAALRKVGVDSAGCVEVQSGTVQMRLPSDSWIDIEEAAHSIDEANGALRAGDTSRAWSHANVVVTVARRPFLPDEEAPWIEAQRAKLRSLLVRGLHNLSRVSAMNGEDALAVQYASEIIDLEPFQESGYRHHMQLPAQMGNRAEALRVFGKCRELLRDELGTNPAPETEALFLQILRAGQ